MNKPFGSDPPRPYENPELQASKGFYTTAPKDKMKFTLFQIYTKKKNRNNNQSTFESCPPAQIPRAATVSLGWIHHHETLQASRANKMFVPGKEIPRPSPPFDDDDDANTSSFVTFSQTSPSSTHPSL